MDTYFKEMTSWKGGLEKQIERWGGRVRERMVGSEWSREYVLGSRRIYVDRKI